MGRIATILAVVLVAAVLTAPASTATTATTDVHRGAGPSERGAGPPSEPPSGVVASPRADRSSAREALRYWTPARMARARPVETRDASRRGARLAPASAGVRRTGAVAAAAAAAPRDEGVRVPRTAGKLFFRTRSGRPAVCSAAVIRARRHNQVVTAGHCVHSGQGGRWHRDWVFVPRYHKGRRPFGRWVSKRAYAPWKWTHRSRFSHDWAIIKFRKRDGRKLQERVGGNRVRLGARPWHRGVHVWGWPAQSPYTGRTAQLCRGTSTRWGGSRHAKIRCDMTGGSSGGPWLLREDRHRNSGIIFAVTSRRTISGTPYLVARPLPKSFATLKRRANR